MQRLTQSILHLQRHAPSQSMSPLKVGSFSLDLVETKTELKEREYWTYIHQMDTNNFK